MSRITRGLWSALRGNKADDKSERSNAMNSSIKIGFIGYGNMAQAMAEGLIEGNVCAKEQIWACAASLDKLHRNAGKLGINVAETPEQLVGQSDVVIIAIKPLQVEAVITPLAGLLKSKIVISVVAGYPFEKYEQILQPGTHHISTIPNTPISVGEGIVIYEKRHSLDEAQFALFTALFERIAIVEGVDSHLLTVAGTISGCTPAYTAMYMEALADAGVKHGLDRTAAYRMVAKMLCGTGKLYLQNETHPGIMKDAVCSPGGDTIKGVAALEKCGFRGAVIEAIDAVEDR